MRRISQIVVFAGAAILLVRALPARAGLITGTNGLSGRGQFEGAVTYTPVSNVTAWLEITLTNTSPAAGGGYLTGFAFNNPSDRITHVELTASNSKFMLLGGPAFQNFVSAGPFGNFDLGAAIGGSFEGGGNPRPGLGVGQTGHFFFALTGTHLDELTEKMFLTTPSAPPGDGQGNPAFAARFRGFQGEPSSDKVLLDRVVVHQPEPRSGVLAGIGVLAVLALPALRWARSSRRRSSA